MIDLKKLQNSLTSQDIIDIVRELGCNEYTDKGDYLIFPTICHNAEPALASHKLYYYKKDHRFMCYTDCGCSFNIYELMKKRFEVLEQDYDFYRDIILRLCDKSKTISIAKKRGFISKYESVFEDYEKNEPEIKIESLKPSLLNSFSNCSIPMWIEDGIDETALKRYNIKFSIDQNKIIIPHYDINNNLIGVRARAIDPEDVKLGKYTPVIVEGKLLSHPLRYNLYGLNLVKDNIKKLKMAIVAEGEKSPMQYETMFGKDNNICVATCGNKVHDYQINLLINTGADKILIAFDKEGENWTEQNNYFRKLKSICNRFSYKVNMGFIYDCKNLLQLKDSPFDRGKDVFLELFKNAIWI